jgi:hypothetical protein
MVYTTQNYWIFGLLPSSGILANKKYDVSETGYDSVLRCLPVHLRTERDPVSETSFFLLSGILDDGKSPKTQ